VDFFTPAPAAAPPHVAGITGGHSPIFSIAYPLLCRSRLPPPPPPSVAGIAGESWTRRPLCRSHLPSLRGITGRVTDPSPPSLGSPGASSPYPLPDERRPGDHGGRVGASSSTCFISR
jgi:hypothetical protein